jgi:hypothetical protein
LSLPLLLIVGPTGSGKTEITRLLLQHLPSNGLVIDASPDRDLSHQLGIQHPATVNQLAEDPNQYHHAEALDWAFHDLLQPIHPHLDLITWGQAPLNTFTQTILTRLLKRVDWAVIDGPDAALSQWLRQLWPHSARTLTVVTPESWENAPVVEGDMWLINRTQGDLPPTLQDTLNEAMTRGTLRLVGKIPENPDPQARAQAFENCLLRIQFP